MREVLDIRDTQGLSEARLRFRDRTPMVRLLMLAKAGGAQTIVLTDGESCPEWDDERTLLESIGQSPSTTISRVEFSRAPQDACEEVTPDDSVLSTAFVENQTTWRIVAANAPPGDRIEGHFLPCLKDQSNSSLPFKQQHGEAGCCAHASLWIATRILQGRDPAAEVISPGDAHRALLQYGPRTPTLPTEGLNLPEVLVLLDRAGYDARVYDFRSQRNTQHEFSAGDQFLYRYVEAGFPVFLALELEGVAGHSIVAVGHTFDPDAWWPMVLDSYYPTATKTLGWVPSVLWAGSYVCHDDNFGPFLNLSRGSVRRRVDQMVVPLPRSLGISILPEEAEFHAAAMIAAILSSSYDGRTHPEARELLRWASEDRLVLRTLLLESSQAIEALRQCEYDAAAIKLIIESLSDGDLLWCVEVSSPILHPSGMKYGELFYKVEPKSGEFGPNLIAAHLPGLTWSSALNKLALTPLDRIGRATRRTHS